MNAGPLLTSPVRPSPMPRALLDRFPPPFPPSLLPLAGKHRTRTAASASTTQSPIRVKRSRMEQATWWSACTLCLPHCFPPVDASVACLGGGEEC